MDKHTLIIGTTSSKCGTCGKGANPSEKTHNTVLGYFAQGYVAPPGCGVRWTHVSSDYVGVAGLYESIMKMRPDLEPDFMAWPPK